MEVRFKYGGDYIHHNSLSGPPGYSYVEPCVTLFATMMHCLDGGTDSRSTLCVNLIYFNNDNLSKLDRYDRAAKVGVK